MNSFSKLIRDSVLKDYANVVEFCKTNRIYKPYLYNALNQINSPDSPWTVEHLERDVMAEHDRGFFKDNFEGKVNSFHAMSAVIKHCLGEWYVRLPTWLENAETILLANDTYRNVLKNSVKMPYFDDADVPSYVDCLSVVRPKNYQEVALETVLGKTRIRMSMAPTLTADEVRNVVAKVISLKDHIGNFSLKDLNISLHPGILAFLQDGSIPEDSFLRSVLATIAVSPSPYTATLLHFIRNATDVEVVKKSSVDVMRSKATDLDIEYGAMSRQDGSPALSSKQIMMRINKHISANGLRGKVFGKDLYYKDLKFFSALRFSTTPDELLKEFFDKTDYFKQFAA